MGSGIGLPDWPQVRIILRADSGFAREALMAWCEANGVDCILGLAKNVRLIRAIGAELAAERDDSRTSGQAARQWSTRKSWSRELRVIGKAEWTQESARKCSRCSSSWIACRCADELKKTRPRASPPARPKRPMFCSVASVTTAGRFWRPV